jgi:ribonuclease BN (tRNA processing enzyme)
VDFCKDVDVLVADAQYTDEEYKSKRGWGHSSVSHVLALAKSSGVRRLVLFHHEPTHDDGMLDRIEKEAAGRARKNGAAFKVLMAREGTTIEV